MRARLLDVTLGDPFSNVALEETLFERLRGPTLRVWNNQKSVIIGRAQLARHETDLAYCRNKSIPVVRRFTAGGAVYNGPGNLNWSFFFPRNNEDQNPRIGHDAKHVFSSFAAIVVRTLKMCGAKCDFNPPNSIVDSHGKVSGMAAYISKTAVLCHGTLLVDADLAEVERLTMPDDAKLEGRYPRSRVAKVSNCGVKREDFVSELTGAFGIRFEEDSLSVAERALASDLADSKYRNERWNLGDPFSLDDL